MQDLYPIDRNYLFFLRVHYDNEVQFYVSPK